MGRVGAAGDNAAMESFFSLLLKNVLDRRVWNTREELRIAIVTWIERTYHRRRRQAALGRLTPVEYELIMKSARHPGGLSEAVTRPCSRPLLGAGGPSTCRGRESIEPGRGRAVGRRQERRRRGVRMSSQRCSCACLPTRRVPG